jgi:hypothetical protein
MWCNLHLDYEIGSQLRRLVCVRKGIYRRPTSKVTAGSEPEQSGARRKFSSKSTPIVLPFIFKGKRRENWISRRYTALESTERRTGSAPSNFPPKLIHRSRVRRLHRASL